MPSEDVAPVPLACSSRTPLLAVLELSDDRVAALLAEERTTEQRIASLTARIEVLSGSLERGDGGAWLRQNAADGLLAPLAELLTVEPGYETAAASALGSLADSAMHRRPLAPGVVDGFYSSAREGHRGEEAFAGGVEALLMHGYSRRVISKLPSDAISRSSGAD